jgi:hypothetical protein
LIFVINKKKRCHLFEARGLIIKKNNARAIDRIFMYSPLWLKGIVQSSTRMTFKIYNYRIVDYRLPVGGSKLLTNKLTV